MISSSSSDESDDDEEDFSSATTRKKSNHFRISSEPTIDLVSPSSNRHKPLDPQPVENLSIAIISTCSQCSFGISYLSIKLIDEEISI